LIFVGPPVVDKTHFILPIEVINNRYKVKFLSMTDLVHILRAQEISSVSRNSVKRIIESDLFIIDNLMFMAMEKDEANLFFQLINKLYG
jgi:DNA replication protein DnaC